MALHKHSIREEGLTLQGGEAAVFPLPAVGCGILGPPLAVLLSGAPDPEAQGLEDSAQTSEPAWRPGAIAQSIACLLSMPEALDSFPAMQKSGNGGARL